MPEYYSQVRSEGEIITPADSVLTDTHSLKEYCTQNLPFAWKVLDPLL